MPHLLRRSGPNPVAISFPEFSSHLDDNVSKSFIRFSSLTCRRAVCCSGWARILLSIYHLQKSKKKCHSESLTTRRNGMQPFLSCTWFQGMSVHTHNSIWNGGQFRFVVVETSFCYLSHTFRQKTYDPIKVGVKTFQKHTNKTVVIFPPSLLFAYMTLWGWLVAEKSGNKFGDFLSDCLLGSWQYLPSAFYRFNFYDVNALLPSVVVVVVLR